MKSSISARKGSSGLDQEGLLGRADVQKVSGLMLMTQKDGTASHAEAAEEAFMRMARAAGVDSTEALITKFITREQASPPDCA